MNQIRQSLLYSLIGVALFSPLSNSSADSNNANVNSSEIYVQSGANKVELIELYTSEGCSSCPPADEWLSSFVERDDLWKRVVPLAFHVDYWDYIGWEDRFANAEFTDRQRDHAARLGMRTIYTPGVFLSGSEWQRWRQGPADFSPEAASGRLDAVINADTGAFTARFVADNNQANSSKNLVLHTALLGFDLSSEVERGENRGRQLRHDFVVLGYQKTKLEQSSQPSEALLALSEHSSSNETASANAVTYVTMANLPTAIQDAPKRAVAFWISHAGSSEPLQATGSWL